MRTIHILNDMDLTVRDILRKNGEICRLHSGCPSNFTGFLGFFRESDPMELCYIGVCGHLEKLN
jgi:hypothetical protein